MKNKFPTYSEIDPRLNEQSFVGKSEQPALWAYCCQRFGEFWKLHKRPERQIPQGWRDGERGQVGWFFPTKWINDFATVPRQEHRSPPAKLQRSPEQRAAYLERVLSRMNFREQLCPKEIERWGLPAGSQITPREVIYPDGSSESVDEVRARYPRFREGAPRQSAEQQNLEDMLRLARRRDAA